MRARFWTVFLLSAIAIVAIAFWLRPAKNTLMPAPVPPIQPAVLDWIAQGVAKSVSGSQAQVQAVISPNTTIVAQNGVGLKEAVVAAQNILVSFYGMVVDQGNQPVSGANIKMDVRNSEYTASNGDFSTYPNTELLADSDGRFEWIGGAAGDVLSIKSITKDGYLLSPKTSLYWNPSSGSFLSPVVFKMWKEGSKEPLISGNHVFGLESDGSIYTLNLLTGKKSVANAEGDLRVAIVRPKDVDPKDKYEWSLMIAGVGGGLIESSDEFMYLAPESGYKPEFKMRLDPIDPLWTGNVTKQFYIFTRNGQIYGNVHLVFHSIYNLHSALEINYTVNPNRSRNLQP